MIRCVRVEIRKNECSTLNGAYPAWELPILEAVHGPDKVVVVGEKLIDRDAPEPRDEFTRLNTRYKRGRNEDGSQGTPFVHMVYGQLGGEKKLADAIQEHIVAAPEGNLVDDSEEQLSSVGG